MNRKLRRLIGLALCGVMALSCAACQKSGDGDDGGTVTLKWIFPAKRQADQDEVWKEFNRRLKEKANINVDIEIVEASYDEKAKMLLATGEDYDICFTSSWSNDYMSAVNKGAYTAIDEYIDKNSDLYKSMPEYVWDSIKVDGKIYGVPSYQLMTYQNALQMPQEVNKQCGFNLEDNGEVVTLDTVEKLIKTAYEKKPTLYGDMKLYATCPFKALLNYEPIASIPNIVIDKNSEDCKIEIDVETDEYKERLKTNREHYNKGYIRSDALSAKGTSGKFSDAISFSTYKPGYQQELRNGYNMDVLIRPLSEPYVEMGCGQKSVMSVLRTSKHPKEAVEFLTLMHTDKELYNLFIYGIEGKHYTKNEDGTVTINADAGYKQSSQWMFGNQFNAYYTDGQDTTAWKKTDENNKSAKVSPLIGFSPDISSIQTEIAQCQSLNSTYEYILTGAVEYDDLYKEYLGKLKAAGVYKIRDEIQNQVNEWLKSKK